MSQTLHQVYQGKALVLTKTMVIKFHKIAESINNDLIDRGYTVDTARPETWKYYLNMFGEYHQADKDRLLELTNGEYDHIRIKVAGENAPVEVDFTKDNLFGNNGDVAVANEYRFNTYYYNSLVSKYSEFEDLILGVLNPISPDISTSAQEGEILYCGGYVKTLLPSGIYHFVRQDYGPIGDNFLIEANEENLIQFLQDYIYTVLERWWNVNYAATSNLFHATFLTLVYLSIPQILGNLRLKNAKTPMAHSFHIREHLESWGGLGWVTEYLSKGVQLWLYRNMVWLNANRGKDKVFKSIIENVLTPSKISIAEHRLRHDVEDMTDENLSATPYFEHIKLNFATNATPTRVEILSLIESEISLASENGYDQAGQAVDIADTSKYSMFDNLNTKVLESTVIDDSNKVPITLEDIALNLWCYTASSGDYRGTVIFTNPINNERIQLTPLNAYILAFYCFNRGWANVDFEYIPTMYAQLIHSHPNVTPSDKHLRKPKLADVSKGVVKPFITDEEITDVLGTYVPQFKHSSSTSFAKEVLLAHEESLRKYTAYTRIEDAQGRGFGEWVSHRCYWYDIECPLTKTETKYADWLTIQGLEVSDYTNSDFIALGTKIVEAAVGVNLNTSEELRNKQAATLAVLKHFSSYAIQIIQHTVASESYWLAWKGLRLTNIKASANNSMQLKLPMYTVKDNWSIKSAPLPLSIFVSDDIHFRKETLTSKVSTPVSDFQLKEIKHTDRMRMKVPSFTIVNMTIPEINATSEEREYSYLTSNLYPFGNTVTASVTATIGSTITMELPVINNAERLATTATIGVMTLSPLTLSFSENLSTSATNSYLNVGNATYTVSDNLGVRATVDTITITPPTVSGYESLNVNGSPITKTTVLAPVDNSDDVVSVTANIVSITLDPNGE